MLAETIYVFFSVSAHRVSSNYAKFPYEQTVSDNALIASKLAEMVLPKKSSIFETDQSPKL